MNKLRQQGFTAVELLITIFIAAIFLFSGYQLYTQVNRDGTNASRMAFLSSKAYEKVKAAAATVSANYPGGCISTSESLPSPPNPPDTESETIAGIGTVTFTTKISCPYGAASSIDAFLINVKASYTYNGKKEVERAIYAN